MEAGVRAKSFPAKHSGTCGYCRGRFGKSDSIVRFEYKRPAGYRRLRRYDPFSEMIPYFTQYGHDSCYLAEVTKADSAYRIAERLHRGQKYSDQDYIEHPIRVAQSFTDPTHRIVAYLHDTVEDTELSLTSISNLFGADVAIAVGAITRKKEQGESYSDYIVRVSKNPMARRVKIADLKDNLFHIDLFPEYESLRVRYKNALRFLSADKGDS